MLEYAKAVLKGVSFSAELFGKEFKKLIAMIQPNEQQELIEWCRIYFNDKYKAIK